MHWLERGELPFNLAGGMDDPHIQYSAQALQPPEGVRPEWEFFIDLALAMKVPMLGQAGVNPIIKLTRWIAKLFNKPDWAFSPALMEKLLLKMSKKVSWKTLMENPHGLQYESKSYGQLAEQLGQQKIQIAPDNFIQELKIRLADLSDNTTESEQEYPFYLMGKRTLHMMNSWQMELDNVQKREAENLCEMHPEDAQQLNIVDGDLVVVSSAIGEIRIAAKLSDKVSAGKLVVQHGWGSRIFSPHDPAAEPWKFGSNRNELVDNKVMDPFSGTPNLNSTRVKIKKCEAA